VRNCCRSGQVYYSCVDSLFVSRLGYERLQVSGLLGSGQPGSLRLWRYTTGWRYSGSITGARRRALRRGGSAPVGRSGQWMHRKARTQIGEGHAPTAEEYLAHVERVSPYRHGVRGADGRVSPWVIEGG
jgi:hypothetical protein